MSFATIITAAQWLLVPVGLLICIPPAGRVALFLLGLTVGLVAYYLVPPGGPDDSTPFLAYTVALAAALVEIPAFFIRMIRKRRSAAEAVEPS